MTKIHIIFYITNIFLRQFAILWVICVGGAVREPLLIIQKSYNLKV